MLLRVSTHCQRLDLDESGAIDLEELNIGLKKIAREDLVQLSPDDFEAVTEHGLLLNEDKELTPAKFEIMMLNQVRGYSHRKVVGAMSKIIEDESVKEMIFALKIILSTVDHLLQNQQHELNKGKTPARLKSRKEVLDKLFHSSVKHAFDAWKKAIEEDDQEAHGAEAKYASGESIYSIDPALRSQVDRMHERLEHLSVSIRQLHEERKADTRSCQAMLANILSVLQEGSVSCPAFKPPGQEEEGNGSGTAIRPGLTDAPGESEVKAAPEGYTRYRSADKVHEQESAGDAAAQRLRDKALFLESIEEYRKAKASVSSHSQARLASLEPSSRRAGAFAQGSGSNIRDRLTGYLNGTSTLQTALSGSSAEGSPHKDLAPVEGGSGNAEPRDWRAASALTSRSPRTFSNHANR